MQSTRAWAVRIIDDQYQRVKDISRLMVCFYVNHHIMQPGTWWDLRGLSTRQSTSIKTRNKYTTNYWILQFMWDCGHKMHQLNCRRGIEGRRDCHHTWCDRDAEQNNICGDAWAYHGECLEKTMVMTKPYHTTDLFLFGLCTFKHLGINHIVSRLTFKNHKIV